MMLQKKGTLFYFFLTLLSLVFPFPNSGNATPLEKVRLQLNWTHQFQFAGYYAAKEQGYYAEAGLDVDIIAGGFEINTVNEVLADTAQYGVTNSEILLHRLLGKPVVALAAIFQHSPLAILSRQDTGITNIQGLVGKRVKLSRTSRDVELHTALKNEGVLLDQLELIEGGASYEDYFSEVIDATTGNLTNQAYYYEKAGVAYSVIQPSSYGVDFYGDSLFTSESEINRHPKRVKAFREASLRGWKYAMNHPEALLELIQTQYQSSKSIEHLRFEASAMKDLILPTLVEIGHMNPGRWSYMAEVLLQQNLADSKEFLHGFIYSPNGKDLSPKLWKIITSLLLCSGLVSLLALTLLVFNKRLKKEISERKAVESALKESEKQLQNYTKQMEQLSLSAASMISIRDERIIFAKISQAIVDYSDYNRVLISLLTPEHPFREIIAHGGITDEELNILGQNALPLFWYEKVFSHGEIIGQHCSYVPHTHKHLLDDSVTLFGAGSIPVTSNRWHPEDNLYVKMVDEDDRFIGVISVDMSKSGHRPTAETVRPLEIFSSLISQIIIMQRHNDQHQALEKRLRQAHKMEAIGNLTGGIAHDFNNILAIILGSTDLVLLNAAPDNPNMLRQLKKIQQAGIRARDIVKQLLTFSRHSEVDFHHTDIVPIINESLQFLRSITPVTIKIIKHIHPIKAIVHCDPTQIHQILINLLTNAFQSMEDSGGVLAMTVRTETLCRQVDMGDTTLAPGDYILIRISDTGQGIAPEAVHQIFDPYYTTKGVGKGTGLGLSIVHGIIQTHMGGIEVRSEPGSGTDITFYLPQSAPDHESQHQQKIKQVPFHRGTEKVLVVDDEQVLLDTVHDLLSSLGYSVQVTNDPSAALEMLRQEDHGINLVLTDVTMPQMTGDILAEKIKEIHPDLPIILITGFSKRVDQQLIERIGISSYLNKPLTLETLGQAVRQALD